MQTTPVATSTLAHPFTAAVCPDGAERTFPPFDLARLLRTVFNPPGGSLVGQRVAILIDLADPGQMRDFGFLHDPALTIQRHAYENFYRELQNRVLAELGLQGGEMFAYQITGGSNLDLPDRAVDAAGQERSLERDVYPHYDLILCISTYSATAPLTAFAKRYGFRGATLHGVNAQILRTGLAVDYDEVSRDAEVLRAGLTRADSVAIEFVHEGSPYRLQLLLGGQEAQKSHGLCRGGPDIANLPAGEVYYVPTGAEGQFPLRYEDGTIGLMTVRGGRIAEVRLLAGRAETVAEHQRKLASDPVTGELGELGFGTQRLPISGRDIQDEKILGTFHIATGRSDHLGGSLTPEKFAHAGNATHDDILFSPTKTPEIHVREVRLQRGGQEFVVIENYQPGAYLRRLMAAA